MTAWLVVAGLLAIIFIWSAVAAIWSVATSIQDVARAIERHTEAVRTPRPDHGPSPPAMSYSYARYGRKVTCTAIDKAYPTADQAADDGPGIVFTERR